MANECVAASRLDHGDEVLAAPGIGSSPRVMLGGHHLNHDGLPAQNQPTTVHTILFLNLKIYQWRASEGHITNSALDSGV